MAADAAALFTGMQLHHAAHPLNLVEVRVQHLEIQHLARRCEEAGGTIGLHRHHAEHALGHITRPAMRAADLVDRSGIPILERFMILLIAAIGQLDQIGAHFLADPDEFHLPAWHLRLKPAIYVGQHKLALCGVRVFRGDRPAQDRRR